MDYYLPLMAIAFAAGIVKGFTGFGGSLVMAPLFALLLGPAATFGTVVVINVATAWQMLRPSWVLMERAVVLPMAVACIVTTPLGILAIQVLDPAQGRRLIGAVVLASGLALLAGLRRNGVARLLPTTLVGGAGGILNGLAGMGGPPAALWLLARDADAGRDRAGLIVYVALTQAAGVVLAIMSGSLDSPTFIRAMWLAPLHVAGATIGFRLFRFARGRAFKVATTVTIIAIGAFATVR
jgi:uncharacterized membrane protein YfcA